MFTHKGVLFNPSFLHLGEILVTGVDENGQEINVQIVDTVLGKSFADTPATLPNPNAYLDPTPIPNPAYQLLVNQAFSKAKAQLEEKAKQP